MRKAPVKLSPPRNQHPAFYKPDALPVAHLRVSKAISYVLTHFFQFQLVSVIS